MTKYRFIKVS